MLVSILHLIIFTLMSLFLVILVLRFLLQMVRADFYNPISQSIVKITMPLLKPLRNIIPGFLGVDMASVVLILVVQFVTTLVLSVVHGVGGVLANPLFPVLWGFVGALSITSNIIFWCMVITIVGSFLAQFSYHPLILLANQIINPFTAPIRRLIPPLGGVIDISPLIILLSLKIVDMLIFRLAVLVDLNPQIVLGYWS
jgi:YggT family protein